MTTEALQNRLATENNAANNRMMMIADSETLTRRMFLAIYSLFEMSIEKQWRVENEWWWCRHFQFIRTHRILANLRLCYCGCCCWFDFFHIFSCWEINFYHVCCLIVIDANTNFSYVLNFVWGLSLLQSQDEDCWFNGRPLDKTLYQNRLEKS